MPKYAFHKLVRDKLPDVYVSLHEKAELKRICGDELWLALKAKFAEEVSELPDSLSDRVALTNELADLLRLIKDTATHAGVAMAEIENADEAKTAQKGGFLEGAYIDTLELDDDDPWNEYYCKQPERFPQLGTSPPSVASIVALSDELAELGNIERATLLPGGHKETDSHHSFSLALIAYDICTKHCPELDANLVLRYALVHDLLEIITGDQDTLHLTQAQLQDKHLREKSAMQELEKRLQDYPALLVVLRQYEKLDTPESASVYVLDKACTIWTHFWDRGASLHARGITQQADIDVWYETQQRKLHDRLKSQPPAAILDIFERSYQKMRTELFTT